MSLKTVGGKRKWSVENPDPTANPIAHGVAQIGSELVKLLYPHPDPDLAHVTKFPERPFMSIFDDMSRVTSFKIYGRLTEEMMDKLVGTPAPSLEKFALYPNYAQASSLVSQQLPVLFAGQHPRLTSLTVGCYSLPGDNHFANLRQFHMWRQSLSSEALESLRMILEASPHMEDLMFTWVKFQADPLSIASAISRVQLPDLRKLSFQEIPLSFVVPMMRWFDVSEQQPLSLTVEAADTGLRTREALWHLQELFKLNPYGIPNDFTRLKIEFGVRECSLVLADATNAVSFRRFSKGDNLILSQLFGRRMAQLRELWIYSSSPTMKVDRNMDLIRDLLNTASNVQRIYATVTSILLWQFWRFLGRSSPALQELHINLPRVPYTTEDATAAYALGDLTEALKNRAAHGLPPLRRLVFYVRDAGAARPSPLYELHERLREGILRAGLPHVETVTVHALSSTDPEACVKFPKMELPAASSGGKVQDA